MISLEAKERYKITKKKYDSSKRGHVMRYLTKARDRAKQKGLPINLDLEHLLSIATDECPVFGIKFVWGRHQGQSHRYTPSLDRVVPELGYIKGNVVFISYWANTIKQDATEKELYAVADWLHDKRKEVLNAQAQSVAPVSERNHIQSAVGAELGAVPTTRTWQNSNNPDNHSGTVRGQDIDHSTEEGGRDSMGCGDQKMGTSETPKSCKGAGQSCAAGGCTGRGC